MRESLHCAANGETVRCFVEMTKLRWMASGWMGLEGELESIDGG